MQTKKYKILFMASEVHPFAKTGGLADVASSLPLALKALGHDIRIVMPKYKEIPSEYKNKMEYVTDYSIHLDWRKQTTIIRKTILEGYKNMQVPCYFVDNAYYFDRLQYYSHHDDAERFAFFNKAVLEMMPKIDFMPDIIHCNDWECGPVGILLKEHYAQKLFYKNIKVLYSIHNLQYQGNFSKDTLGLLGLHESYYHPDGLEFYGNINYMKAGIVHSDALTTVSMNYANEIQTPEYGCGLDGIIRKRKEDLYGILNGINDELYNPQIDRYIYKTYHKDDLDGKLYNKQAFQNELGLLVTDTPLIGVISRLADQKGFDLIEECIDDIMQMDVQLVVLGTGDPIYEDIFCSMQKKYPDKIRAAITFNTAIAQKIYASSDIFLMPSKFEPCGLSQLISMRYGTIPIVRKTGGLADTVQEFNPEKNEGNGFVFSDYSSKELLNTIKRALHVYTANQEQWRNLSKKVMELDYSWESSAKKYVEVYAKVMQK